MSSSTVSPDDSRGIGTKPSLVHRFMAFGFNRPKIILPLWAGLVVFASISELLPGDSAPLVAVSHVNDKLLHFSAYAAMAFVPAFGLRLGEAAAYILATELLGIGLEFAQLFVRQRSCDPYDVAANTAGVLIGVLLAIAFRARFLRAEQNLSEQ
jgi:VanZ family protein